ncbi:hypothetical protein PC41400_07960 [Paenibacillus chitinolyticus]|uniref:Uncharacterized protein n=1 Tax=Paenibacillus chitinolyticus TaxID=79263 RepID=A0A410WTE8_9BACL|nr:hypothetical protein [Paenibacillus chitinolyticus]MCY9588642.1 hypothetical protein [Paenibacillus chitinolyticus]MCY9595854.1 hypothetical protein [Paenibacillus chitinolyticus]QAV17601.1 hypothetical protein PC41400_07960 [Paenibacillus chitinolyticus]
MKRFFDQLQYFEDWRVYLLLLACSCGFGYLAYEQLMLFQLPESFLDKCLYIFRNPGPSFKVVGLSFLSAICFLALSIGSFWNTYIAYENEKYYKWPVIFFIPIGIISAYLIYFFLSTFLQLLFLLLIIGILILLVLFNESKDTRTSRRRR